MTFQFIAPCCSGGVDTECSWCGRTVDDADHARRCVDLMLPGMCPKAPGILDELQSQSEHSHGPKANCDP